MDAKKLKDNSSRIRNTVLNLITGIGGQMLSTLLKFVTRTVFIYTLGKSYLGINGLFSDILSMLSLTELGLDMAINFKLYKPLAEKDNKRVRVLMKFYKQAYRVIGLVIFLVGLCLIPALHLLIKDYDSLEVLGINATLIFVLYLLQTVSSYLFWAYRSAVLKANQKQYILSIAEYAITIANNIVQILVLIFSRNFVLYTVVIIIFTIIKNYINATISKRYYPHFFEKEKENLNKQEVLDMFKDCGAIFIYKVNTVVLKATDNLILSTFIGLAIVGMYSNYLMLYHAIRDLLQRFYSAVKASMGNLYASEDIVKKYDFFEIMNFLTIVLYGTAGVGVAVCADEVIDMWLGSEYVISQPFSILMGIEILFLGLRLYFSQIRSVTGIFRQMWFRPVLGIVINLGVSIGLVFSLGIYGVLIGTIVSTMLTNFLVDPSIIHKYSFNNYKPVSVFYLKNGIYILVLICVTVIDMCICFNFFVGHGWFSALVHVVIVGVSVPGAFVLLFWKRAECQYLVKLGSKMISKFKRSDR